METKSLIYPHIDYMSNITLDYDVTVDSNPSIYCGNSVMSMAIWELPGLYDPDITMTVNIRASEWPSPDHACGFSITGGDVGVGVLIDNDAIILNVGESTSDSYNLETLNLDTWYELSCKISGVNVSLELDGVEICSGVGIPYSPKYIYVANEGACAIWVSGITYTGTSYQVLPTQTVQGEIDTHFDIWMPRLSISGIVINNRFLSGTLSLPIQEVAGEIGAGPHADLESEIPPIRGGIATENYLGYITYAAGNGGAFFEKEIPMITLVAEGNRGIKASLSRAIPGITLIASANKTIIGNLIKTIPAIKSSTTIVKSESGSLTRPMPMVRLTASAINGMIATLEQSIASININANGYWLSGGTLQSQIPSIRLSASVSGDIIALVVNIKNYALSVYTDYDYNSMCMFKGVMLGAKNDGLYELSGDGNVENIITTLRTGLIEVKDNRLREIWIYGALSGDFNLAVETSTGTRYEYDVMPIENNENATRVKLGKGIRSKYVTIELQSSAYNTITIDKIEGYGLNI